MKIKTDNISVITGNIIDKYTVIMDSNITLKKKESDFDEKTLKQYFAGIFCCVVNGLIKTGVITFDDEKEERRFYCQMLLHGIMISELISDRLKSHGKNITEPDSTTIVNAIKSLMVESFVEYLKPDDEVVQVNQSMKELSFDNMVITMATIGQDKNKQTDRLKNEVKKLSSSKTSFDKLVTTIKCVAGKFVNDNMDFIDKNLNYISYNDDSNGDKPSVVARIGLKIVDYIDNVFKKEEPSELLFSSMAYTIMMCMPYNISGKNIEWEIIKNTAISLISKWFMSADYFDNTDIDGYEDEKIVNIAQLNLEIIRYFNGYKNLKKYSSIFNRVEYAKLIERFRKLSGNDSNNNDADTDNDTADTDTETTGNTDNNGTDTANDNTDNGSNTDTTGDTDNNGSNTDTTDNTDNGSNTDTTGDTDNNDSNTDTTDNTDNGSNTDTTGNTDNNGTDTANDNTDNGSNTDTTGDTDNNGTDTDNNGTDIANDDTDNDTDTDTETLEDVYDKIFTIFKSFEDGNSSYMLSRMINRTIKCYNVLTKDMNSSELNIILNCDIQDPRISSCFDNLDRKIQGFRNSSLNFIFEKDLNLYKVMMHILAYITVRYNAD